MADRLVISAHSRTQRAIHTPRFSGALKRFVTAMLFTKEIWLIYTAGFLCGRASWGPGIFPFGLALFWTVVRSQKRTHAIGAAFAVLLGMATVAPAHRLLAIVVVLLGGLFVHTEETEQARSKGTYVWRQAVLIAVSHAVSRVVFARLFEAGWENPVWMLMEALLLASAIVLWRPLSNLWSNAIEQPISREGWVSVALFAVMLSLGLNGIQYGPFVPAEIWNRLITVVAALIGGPATGAAVGTALGWITGMGGIEPLGGVSIYALAGLFAGLFAVRGKLWVGTGFFLGHVVLSIQISSPNEIVHSLMHALVALAFLAIIPSAWLRSLERTLPGSRARERFMEVREDRLREAVSERLTKVSLLLSEMGRTFVVAGHTAAKSPGAGIEIDDVIEGITERLCLKCPAYKKCWEDQLHQTYRGVVEFLSSADAKGVLRETAMPLQLRQRCFRTAQLTQTAHAVLAELHERERWQRRLEGQSNVIPLQLQGIASIIEGLAEQVRVETGRSDEIQVMLTDALREVRNPASRVEVRPLGNSQRFEILVERSSPCDRIGLWKEQVEHVVTTTLGGSYTVWHEECPQHEGSCRVWLSERPPYALDQASISLAKERGAISGDSITTVELIDGRVAMILSDGMGTGHEAAVQSESAVQLLGTLLKTGFDLRSAVRSVNSLLLMRTAQESFATIDAVVIDQFTGVAEFLKVGSAPTFIKRGTEVDVIRSASMPVGIVKQVDVRVQQRQLQLGDTVILVTDGLLDSVNRNIEQEEWLARVLQRENGTSPQALLDATLARAGEAATSGWSDDITLAVIRLVERRPMVESHTIPEYRRVGGVG